MPTAGGKRYFMAKKITLPKIADILYVSKDAYDFLVRLNSQTQKLSGDFFYADQISLKLDEAALLIKDTDNENENPFLKKARGKWSKDLRKELVAKNIFYKSKMRRKDIFAILSKMNRCMTDGKSINSIHDLTGMEFKILTPQEFDTEESIRQMYQATNIILDYFSDSKRSGEKFMLCDASPLKDVYPLEEMPSKLTHFKSINPNCFIPKESGLLPNYSGFVKDYYIQPKIKSCYQGVQFVFKTDKGIYCEVQLKTQPVIDFKNNPKSPAYHVHYRTTQTKDNQEKTTVKPDVPQFDLSFDPKKVTHIYGFRANPTLDNSGILKPVCWDLRKNTHF